MQVVIKISDDDCERIKDIPDAFNSLTSRAYRAIANGTPLPKGHWEIIGHELYLCSKCYSKWTMKLNHCPNCGADMREEDKEVSE